MTHHAPRFALVALSLLALSSVGCVATPQGGYVPMDPLVIEMASGQATEMVLLAVPTDDRVGFAEYLGAVAETTRQVASGDNPDLADIRELVVVKVAGKYPQYVDYVAIGFEALRVIAAQAIASHQDIASEGEKAAMARLITTAISKGVADACSRVVDRAMLVAREELAE